MDIEWLEDFIALIDHGSFSRAAEARSVSQPTFSRRIRSLEKWVGTTLVDRTTHTLRLTPAGERFRTVAEETLRRLRVGRNEVRLLARASSKTLRLASTHVLSMTFFPAWLRQMDLESPTNGTMELTADNMVACEKRMVEGKSQFLLCHHHPAAATRMDADFRSIRLGEDLLIPVLSPELAERYALNAAPQLAFTEESGMGRILKAAWLASGRRPPRRPIFSSHLASVLVEMARDGRGATWTARSLVEDDLESGRLVHAGTPEDDIPIEIRLWRAKARQAPVAERFWEKVKKRCPEGKVAFP
ncbi:LysR family transcriptional regulator [Cryptosporangium sp. NPDC048952]|uniref:LysR family transcriptional regulator n=1 Tax=Cryptosporangium sp. NPDC048952 TaxID=3363961 RepID=UPI003723C793